MATKFLEPGGDATFNVATTTNGGFWATKIGSPAVATDFVHGTHVKSIKYRTNNQDIILTQNGTLSDAGSRISFYLYINALPAGTSAFLVVEQASIAASVASLQITSGGVLQLYNDYPGNQIGSNGATLSTGQWYRISLAYTITDTTHNRFEVFVNGVSSISVTNATLTNITSSAIIIGNVDLATLDIRSSDHYIDDSSSLTDTGDIWVTAKRPNANGTTNDFSTQIGSGGSGYGTGHSPQVNERPLSTTNGWSMIGAGSEVEEAYTIESASTGDINITGFSIVDSVSWVYASSLISEIAQIIYSGTTSNINLTSTPTMFTKVMNLASYPSGSGADTGLITSADLTTVSLYECGIMIAYTPPPPATIWYAALV